MDAVILAAGKGSRLRPLTKKTPKPLLKLKNNETILEVVLKSLPKKVTRVVIVVNYLKEKIINKIGKRYGKLKIDYVFHQKLDGTAKALWKAKNLIKDDFLVLNADDIYDLKGLKNLIKHDYAIMVYKKTGYPSGGVVKIKKDMLLKEIVDYPNKADSTYLLNTGAYKLNKDFFLTKPVLVNKKSNEYGLPQTLAHIAKNKDVKVIISEKYYQINIPKDLEAVRKKRKKQKPSLKDGF